MKNSTSVERLFKKQTQRSAAFRRICQTGTSPQKIHLYDELALNNDLAFARQVSESYFINCWQLFEGETLDMWKTYGNGVAIFSRFELLKSQLAPMLDNMLWAWFDTAKKT